MNKPSREEAFAILKAYNQSERLIKHALTAEAVMIHFSRLFGEDAQMWGVIGLIHDVDYEHYPDEHCHKAREILESHNWPEGYIHAVQSHGYNICTDVKPVNRMEKVLYAIDELTGLIAATVYMRPSRSIHDLTTASVKKKWKQKSFAAGANREIIEMGAAELGMDLDTLISETIEGMKTEAQALGLNGDAT